MAVTNVLAGLLCALCVLTGRADVTCIEAGDGMQAIANMSDVGDTDSCFVVEAAMSASAQG
eukprot:12790783-Alexandrium_andersonii.AAC.1